MGIYLLKLLKLHKYLSTKISLFRKHVPSSITNFGVWKMTLSSEPVLAVSFSLSCEGSWCLTVSNTGCSLTTTGGWYPKMLSFSWALPSSTKFSSDPCSYFWLIRKVSSAASLPLINDELCITCSTDIIWCIARSTQWQQKFVFLKFYKIINTFNVGLRFK